jgi:hypothetical protein
MAGSWKQRDTSFRTERLVIKEGSTLTTWSMALTESLRSEAISSDINRNKTPINFGILVVNSEVATNDFTIRSNP